MRKIITLLALLLFVVSQSAFAQRTISGRVISGEDGLGMPGVPVVVRGTTIGMATDVNGNFTLSVPDNATIVVSFMGFRTQELAVGNQTQFNITLQPDVLTLGDVVVTALGITREVRTLTYSAQQVSGEEMMRAQDINFMGSLQGRAAGLEITRTGSGAGGSTRTVLRGAKSFSGNSAPLYVIDGVPLRSSGGASGAVWGSYDSGDALSQINPEDIESISVLKGANAAMLYGSAGANGVIMITTRRGKEGPVQISISNATTFESVLIWPELQYKYGAIGSQMENWDITPLSNPGFTEKDMKNFFNTALNVVNNISISGGTRNTTVFFSYGNTIASGIVPENTYRRDNVSLRQSTRFFNDKVQISTNVMLSSNMSRNRTPSGGFQLNPITALYWFPRNLNISEFRDEVLDSDGYPIELSTTGGVFGNGLAHGWRKFNHNRQMYEMNWLFNDHFQSNPWWITKMQPRWDGGKRLNSSVTIAWDIIDNLKLTVRGNYDYSTSLTEHRHYANSNRVNGSGPNGTWSFSQGINYGTYVDGILAYNAEFGDFNLNAILGGSFQERGSGPGVSVSTGSGTQPRLMIPNVFTFQNIHEAVMVNTTGNSLTLKGGLFANTTLGFRNMIFLELSGRNDWSSTLAGTDVGISYFYPAVGLSAVISQMVTLPSFITFGKVRASYTTVANDMGFDNIFQRTTINSYQGGLSTPTRPDWTDAKPELIESFEFGTDWRFLEGKVGFDLSYYYIVSTNQRLSVTTPQGGGFNSRTMNLGKIVNEGIELMIDGEPVSAGSFSWKTSVNFASNKSTIVEVNPNDPTRKFEIGSSDSFFSYAAPGGSFGDIWTYTFQYHDENGKLLLSQNLVPIRSAETELVGRSTPNFTIGWNNNFRYKRWSMGFLINGIFGGKTISMTEAMFDFNGVSKRTADARDLGFDAAVNRADAQGNPITTGWVEVDAIIHHPGGATHGNLVDRVDARTWYGGIGNRAGLLEAYLYDRTNVRFTQFSFSYDIPVRQLSLPLRSASVGVTGQNLFFLYRKAPHDPELTMGTGNLQGIDNHMLPATRTIGFNIRLNF